MTEDELAEIEESAYTWKRRAMRSNTDWARRHAAEAERFMMRAEMGDEEDD